MATLTISLPTAIAAVALGAVAAESGGDQFLNDGRVFVYAKNTNASSRTVTIVTSGSLLGGLSIGDVAFALAQDEEKVVGPFPPRYFNDSGGYVQITYSAVTGVTVAAIKLT